MSTHQADITQPELPTPILKAIAKVTATDKAVIIAYEACQSKMRIYGASTDKTSAKAAAAECKVSNEAYFAALEAYHEALKQLDDLESLFPSLAKQIAAQLTVSSR